MCSTQMKQRNYMRKWQQKLYENVANINPKVRQQVDYFSEVHYRNYQ